MARILPWACEEITTFDELDECHKPDSPVSRWTVNQSKDFLRPRRLPLGGCVAELRKLVTENRSTPIPELVGGPASNASKMTVHFWQMISYFMGVMSVDEDFTEQKNGRTPDSIVLDVGF